jgi:nucleoside-diphosphate-sugar epimerase
LTINKGAIKMRVFVTGATGFIGSAVVKELIAAGHQVLGLARSDASVKSLTATGASAHRGSLENLESLRSGAAAVDGVIHLAYIHKFPQFLLAGRTDKRAIEALGSALEGSNRPLVVAAGTAFLKPGSLLTETDSPRAAPRKSEETTLALVSRGVNASVVRLPPSVHGDGDQAFVPNIIGIGRKKGVSAYVGNGLNRWSSVHRLDAAQLFRLALEKGSAGARYHGVADEGVPFGDIAEVIGRRLNVPVMTKSSFQAVLHFGWLGFLTRLDCPASSALTRDVLGWQPTQVGLIDDLEQGHYFQ